MKIAIAQVSSIQFDFSAFNPKWVIAWLKRSKRCCCLNFDKMRGCDNFLALHQIPRILEDLGQSNEQSM